MYIHLLPIYLLPIHGYAACAFLGIGSFFTNLNHSRFDVTIPGFWSSLDHDIHHRLATYNYGQYVMTWDWLFNTYQAYYDRPKPIPDYGDKRKVSDRSASKVVIIGSEGLVGHRLVEMSLERGATEVIAVDIKNESAFKNSKVTYIRWDISKPDDGTLARAWKGADVVFHVAALVGPYHSKELYEKVNVEGTKLMLRLTQSIGCDRYVYVGSPSVRFGPWELVGQHEASAPYPEKSADEYARTKTVAEKWVMAQNTDNFYTVVVSPHQVYGPNDRLFMYSFLDAAKTGKLRILGTGQNIVSFTHVDNIVHAIMLAANAVGPDSPANGEVYIITDGDKQNFWDVMDVAVTHCGLPSLKEKFPVPIGILYPIACLSELYGWLTGTYVKLTRYSIRMITMHRWFRVDKAEHHLGYTPVTTFEKAWLPTISAVWSALNNTQKVA